MYRARTKPSWWPKWPDTLCVGVDRGAVARAWCLGDRFAVGCGVRETLGATRGIPGEIAAGVAVRLSLRSGAGVTPAEIRRGDPRPAPRCVVRVPRPRRLHRSPSWRPSARTPLHGRQRLPLARCGLSPSPIARVHLGHACAARADRRRLAHAHHVPRVARSARGRPAAASAWAPRSISSAPCPTARAASGEGVLPDAARACTPTRAQSSPEAATVRAVRLHAWHPTKCR